MLVFKHDASSPAQLVRASSCAAVVATAGVEVGGFVGFVATNDVAFVEVRFALISAVDATIEVVIAFSAVVLALLLA